MRRAYAGVLWLCCVFYYLSLPLVLLSVVAVAAALVLGMLAAGFIAPKLLVLAAIISLVTIGAIVKSLLVRPVDEDPGSALDLSQHPRLKGLLKEVAEKLETRPVDRVFLTPGTDLAVFERGGMMQQLRGSTDRCLILGAGVLDGMSDLAFKSVLAHEYGHFKNEDTAGGGLALGVRRSLLTMAKGLAESGAAAWYNPAWIFLNAFFRVFMRISQGASRLQEVLADRWAVKAYGSAAFRAGLGHVIERSIRFDHHVNATLTEVMESGTALPNLYRYKPAEGADEGDIEEAIEDAINAEPSVYDSHPSPRDRFAWADALNVELDTGKASVVWDLFDDRRDLEKQMTGEVRTNLAVEYGVQIPT